MQINKDTKYVKKTVYNSFESADNNTEIIHTA